MRSQAAFWPISSGGSRRWARSACCNLNARRIAAFGLIGSVLLVTPASAALDDPPPGLITSSTTLAKVRALYERAHAKEHTKGALLVEEWRLVQDGQVGTFRVRRYGKDYRETTALGPLVYDNGVHNGTRWQQNRNGITFTFVGFHERDAVDGRAWETVHDTKNVHLIGESIPANAYVVDVNPPAGRHQWLFIEKRTGYVVRRERVEKHRRYVTTYDDYKPFDGVAEPSRIRTVDSYGNDRELTLVSRVLETVAGDPKELDIPPSRRTLVEFPPATSLVRLPVRFTNGLLVAKVYLNAHPYEFLLDSGAAGIVVDPSVAEALGIERYGARVGATIGTFAESTAIVPSISVGALRMRNVVSRIVTVPFRIDERTRIAGLLGFDFFADAVVHIDTERNIVDAIAPAAFRPPGDTVPVPLALDDKTPAVRTRVGTVAARVVLDTGANRTVIQSAFADRADVVDRSASVARFRGVGGIGTAETARIKQLEFAGSSITDAMVDISNADLGTEDVDGILGTDLLRNFDMFFDYRANMIYVRRLRR